MRICKGTRRRPHERVGYKGSCCPLCQEMLRSDGMMEQRDDVVRELNQVKAHIEELKWSKFFVGPEERRYFRADEA